MAGQRERLGADRETQEYLSKMKAQMRKGQGMSQGDTALSQNSERLASAISKRSEIRILATNPSDVNALNQAIADPEKPHIEAYPSGSDEQTKSE